MHSVKGCDDTLEGALNNSTDLRLTFGPGFLGLTCPKKNQQMRDQRELWVITDHSCFQKVLVPTLSKAIEAMNHN